MPLVIGNLRQGVTCSLCVNGRFGLFFYFDILSTVVPEKCQKLHYKEIPFTCLSGFSEHCIICFILLCLKCLLITGFASLLRCQSLPDFIMRIPLGLFILEKRRLGGTFSLSTAPERGLEQGGARSLPSINKQQDKSKGPQIAPGEV